MSGRAGERWAGCLRSFLNLTPPHPPTPRCHLSVPAALSLEQAQSLQAMVEPCTRFFQVSGGGGGGRGRGSARRGHPLWALV